LTTGLEATVLIRSLRVFPGGVFSKTSITTPNPNLKAREFADKGYAKPKP
jgi:hypothetical protein